MFITKEAVLLKLAPYGIKTIAGINGLIRKEGLPARYITPRKVIFAEADIDTWLANRPFGQVASKTTHNKVIKAQRNKKKGDSTKKSGISASPEMKVVKA